MAKTAPKADKWLQAAVRKLYGKGIINSDSDIAKALGIHKSSVSNYIRGRVTPSGNFMRLFEDTYGPLLNEDEVPTKLVKYETKVYKTKAVNEASVLPNTDLMIMQVPLVIKYAYAGYLSGYGDAEFIEELPKYPFLVDREYKGNYMAFEVKGESMNDGSRAAYLEGDILLCREVPQHHWKDKLHIKKWDFVIVTRRDGILVKKITAHDAATGAITLHSLNPDFEDIKMNLNNVAQIFNVVKVAITR